MGLQNTISSLQGSSRQKCLELQNHDLFGIFVFFNTEYLHSICLKLINHNILSSNGKFPTLDVTEFGIKWFHTNVRMPILINFNDDKKYKKIKYNLLENYHIYSLIMMNKTYNEILSILNIDSYNLIKIILNSIKQNIISYQNINNDIYINLICFEILIAGLEPLLNCVNNRLTPRTQMI